MRNINKELDEKTKSLFRLQFQTEIREQLYSQLYMRHISLIRSKLNLKLYKGITLLPKYSKYDL